MMISLYSATQHLSGASWGNLPFDAFLWILAQGIQDRQISSQLWIVTPTEQEALEFRAQISFWLQSDIGYYPANEPDTIEGMSPARHIPQQRMLALHQWYAQKTIMVSSVFGLMHYNLNQNDFEEACIHLQVGGEYDPKHLAETFQNLGYLPARELDEPGLFKHHGDAIQIWKIGDPHITRLSFFDTELEAIHVFHQNERQELQKITIIPAREMIFTKESTNRLYQHLKEYIAEKGYGREIFRRITQDLQNGIWFPGAEEYVPALFEMTPTIQNLSTKQLIVWNPLECLSQANIWSQRLESRWNILTPDQCPLIEKTARFMPFKEISTLLKQGWHCTEEDSADILFDVEKVHHLQTPQHQIEPLIKILKRWQKYEYTIIFVANSHNRIQRLQSLLQGQQIKVQQIDHFWMAPSEQISICKGDISEGFIDHQAKLAVLCVEYLLQIPKSQQRNIPKTLREAVISNIAEIKPGDIVVHKKHGIGRFLGIVQQEARGVQHDCVHIEYANNAAFYMPVSNLEELYRYRSLNNANPKLDKLGSPSWEKRLKKVNERIGAMATELIKQFALRANQGAYEYIGFPQLLNDFALSFPHQETPDQQHAIDDVLRDLASSTPMNRLVVGDVGFGKTEVALRAAVRVVAQGHQVVLLCPTTILAMQHHKTFVERCLPFNINVGLISRMQTSNTKKKLFKKLQEGEIHILIGTQAIFGKDLRFKHLGLVIVDEEHRFGVKQKEQLQNLSQLNPTHPLEYLAMSATPIPRTLHLALSGMRDVSTIATPPPNRRAIQTRFMKYDMSAISKQIDFELKRGGQVFFVHNVVKELSMIASEIQKYVPHAKIEIASGQHSKNHLESVMMNVWNKETHILVCTTIIENGIDLPNVNTIFINQAHNMGLAQLYQLRGRVGRGKEQGYCTLLTPERGLSSDALSRVNALKQYTALGAGFAIANADLEIRGSGDLLGKDQSGHIEAIGLDTYIDLLNEAILEMKSAKLETFVPQIQVPLSATLPPEYIPDIEQRLHSYRQMATAQSFAEIQEVLDDWERNYGPPPELALNTIRLAEVRMWAKNLGIHRIDWLKSRVRLISHSTSTLDWKQVEALCKEHSKTWEFVYQQQNIWSIFIKFSYEDAKTPFTILLWILGQLDHIQK